MFYKNSIISKQMSKTSGESGFFLAAQRIHELVEQTLNKLAQSIDPFFKADSSSSPYERHVRIANGVEYKLEAVVSIQTEPCVN
jgi:hypothetical protein